MAEGAKVGDVFVEGRLEYDGSSTPAFANAMQRHLDREMKKLNTQNLFKDFHKDLHDKTSNAIVDGVGDGLKRAPKEHKGNAIQAGQAIGEFLSMGTALGLKGNARLIRDAMVVAMAGAGTVIVATLGAAIQAAFAIGPAALGSLPGLMLGAASGFGVLALSLSGLADGFEEVFGAQEKFEKKTKNLGVEAKAFLQVIRDHKDELIGFRNTIQDVFFKDTDELFDPVMRALHELEPELKGVADRFHDIGVAMIRLGTQQGTLNDFKDILSGVDAFLNIIRPGLLSVVSSFIDLGAQGASFAEILGIKVNRALMRLAEIMENVDLKQFFEDAKPAMHDIHRILDAIVGTLRTLFGGEGAKEGGGFLEFLADLAEAAERGAEKLMKLIKAISELPDHTKQLIGMGAIVALAISPLSGIVGNIAGVADAFLKLGGALMALGVAGPVAAAAIGAVVVGILSALGIFILAWQRSEAFRQKIKETGEMVKRAWEENIRPALQALGTQMESTLTAAENMLAELGLDWGDLGHAVKMAVGLILAWLIIMLGSWMFIFKAIELRMIEFKAMIEGVKNTWNDAMNGIGIKSDELANFMNTHIWPKWEAFYTAFRKGTQEFVNMWFGAWLLIPKAVEGAVNQAIGFINGLISAFKSVASKFGINIDVAPIPLMAAQPSSPQGFHGFNRGGIAPGTGNKDTVPAMLTPGEGILSKPEMKKIGGAAGFAKLRQNLQHFASGGIVQGLDGEQSRNAGIIAQVASQMGLGSRAVQIAIATALQESGLRNLSHGDRDSLGLFQQRPSQGWGNASQIMNPAYAAQKFFEKLMGIPYQTMSLAQAAQSVQRSAFPDAYAKWEATAAGFVGGGADVFADLFSPVDALVDKLKSSVPNFGAGQFGEMAKAMIMQLIDGGKKFITDNFVSMPGMSSGGSGFAAMTQIISKLVPGARVSSGPRPGSRGSSGNLDYHHYGRAIDIVPAPGGIANAVVAVVNKLFKPMTKELIHTPAGNMQIHNGRNATFSADVAAGHYDHVHWAMDNAGVLPPHSDTMIRNATSSNEYVMTAKHMQDFMGTDAAGGGKIEAHFTVLLDGEIVDAKILENDMKKNRQNDAGRRL